MIKNISIGAESTAGTSGRSDQTIQKTAAESGSQRPTASATVHPIPDLVSGSRSANTTDGIASPETAGGSNAGSGKPSPLPEIFEQPSTIDVGPPNALHGKPFNIISNPKHVTFSDPSLPDPSHPDRQITQTPSFQANLCNVITQYEAALRQIAELEKANASLRNKNSSLEQRLESAREKNEAITEERDELKEQLQEAFKEMALKYEQAKVARAEQVWQHIAAGSKGSLIFTKPWVKERKAVSEE